jgi:pentatricopeptide repeat-containing protein PET309
MPMLERAGPTLEHQTFPPFFTSRAPAALASQRRLQRAFWRHGAVDIEPCDASQILTQGIPSVAAKKAVGATPDKATTLVASTFLLDFLYPNGALSRLRKLLPAAFERYEIPLPQNSGIGMRHFTSTAPRTKKSRRGKEKGAEEEDADSITSMIAGGDSLPMDDEFPLRHREHEFPAAQAPNLPATASVDSMAQEDRTFMQPEDSVPEDPEPEDVMRGGNDSTWRIRPVSKSVLPDKPDDLWWMDWRSNGERAIPRRETSKKPKKRRKSPLPSEFMAAEDFAAFIRENPTTAAEDVWKMYIQIGPDACSTAVRRQVMRHFTRTGGVHALNWSLEVFNMIDRSDWDPEIVAAAIRSNLYLDRAVEAVLLFKTSLHVPNSLARLDLLLANAVRTRQWNRLFDVWQIYAQSPERKTLTVGCLRRLESVSFVVAALARLHRDAVRDFELPRPSENRAAVEALVKLFSDKLILQLTPGLAWFALSLKKSPDSFEQYITLCAANKRLVNANHVYRRYRATDGAQISLIVLKTMVQVYSPSDPEGMELVRKDWYQRYNHLNVYGYRHFLKFYANRGEVVTTNRLWNEFVEIYPQGLLAPTEGPDTRDTFTYLLQVHAVRGDLPAVERVFGEIAAKYNAKPNTACWNILLSTYVRVDDLEGAIACFGRLCEAVEPDVYSYATLMSLVGSTGDLDYVLQLSEDAQDRGIEANVPMMKGIVWALCENDRADDAERLCEDATERHAGGRQICSILWDLLLRYHSRRRDLRTVNRLIELMEHHDVPLSTMSYESVLRALCLTGQVRHAQRLIDLGLDQKVFPVKPEHLVTLMSGYLLVGQPNRVLQVNETMESLHMPRHGARTAMVLTAMTLQQERKPERQRRRDDQVILLQELLNVFQDVLEGNDQPDAASQGKALVERSTIQIERTAELFSRMVEILTYHKGMRKLVNPRLLLDEYERVFPQQAGAEHLPLRLLSASITVDYHNKEFDRAKESFGALLQRALQARLPRGGGAHGQVLLPTGASILSDALIIMQRICLAEKDPNSLRELIDLVASYGFTIDNRNYNFYVQNLANMNQWQTAFDVCEKKLMPAWHGFRITQVRGFLPMILPTGPRQMPTTSQTLRPAMYTLYVLAREYRSMLVSQPWSHVSARALATVEEDSPRTVEVVKGWWNQVYMQVRRQERMTGSVSPEEDPRNLLPGRPPGLEEDGAVAWNQGKESSSEQIEDEPPADEAEQSGNDADSGRVRLNYAKQQRSQVIDRPSEQADGPDGDEASRPAKLSYAQRQRLQIEDPALLEQMSTSQKRPSDRPKLWQMHKENVLKWADYPPSISTEVPEKGKEVAERWLAARKVAARTPGMVRRTTAPRPGFLRTVRSRSLPRRRSRGLMEEEIRVMTGDSPHSAAEKPTAQSRVENPSSNSAAAE